MSKTPSVTAQDLEFAKAAAGRRRLAAEKAAAKALRAAAGTDAKKIRKSERKAHETALRAAKAERQARKLKRRLSATSGCAAGRPEARAGSERADAPRSTSNRHIYLCRGCCCGKRKKHPDVDHDQIKRTVKETARKAGMPVTITGCLGPCGQGNMLVVRNGNALRWFRKMNDAESVRSLLDHVAGGRDLDNLPRAVEANVMARRDGREPRW